MCRKPERTLNSCMFEKLVRSFSSPYLRCSRCLQGLLKTIPGTPEGKKPIHEVEKPIFTGVQR